MNKYKDFIVHLKNIRLEKNISLEELSCALNIRRNYLEALEEQRTDDLPAPVYVYGYIKLIAEYFNVPINKFTSSNKQIVTSQLKDEAIGSADLIKAPKKILVCTSLMIFGFYGMLLNDPLQSPKSESYSNFAKAAPNNATKSLIYSSIKAQLEKKDTHAKLHYRKNSKVNTL